MACRRASFVRHICCTWLLLYHSTRAHPAPPKHKNENSEVKHLPDDITVRQIQRSFSYAFSLWPLPKYRPPDEQREGFVRSSLGRYKNLRFGYSKR